MVPHKQEQEHYICSHSTRYEDEILFCDDGGVDVGDVDAKAQRMRIPPCASGSTQATSRGPSRPATVATIVHARDAHALQRGHAQTPDVLVLPADHEGRQHRRHLRHTKAVRPDLEVRMGYSNGIVPMLRNFNETARYVDQGSGKRKGSCCCAGCARTWGSWAAAEELDHQYVLLEQGGRPARAHPERVGFSGQASSDLAMRASIAYMAFGKTLRTAAWP
jgi:hypothetical protein